MRLLFDPRYLRRTMTRDEWRAIDRWRRTTERTLRQHEDQMRLDLTTFGATGRQEIMNCLVNPPVMVHAAMPEGWPLSPKSRTSDF